MYRHRVIDDRNAGSNATRNIWFFSNSTDEQIDTEVSLRGTFKNLAWWNPHDGTTTAIENPNIANGRTQIPLKLDPVRSGFLVAE